MGTFFGRATVVRKQLLECSFGLKVITDAEDCDLDGPTLLTALQQYLSPGDFAVTEPAAWEDAGGEFVKGVDPELPQLTAIKTAEGWEVSAADPADDLVRYLESHGIDQSEQLKFVADLILQDETFLSKLMRKAEAAPVPRAKPAPEAPAAAAAPATAPVAVSTGPLAMDVPVAVDLLMEAKALFANPGNQEEGAVLEIVALPGGESVVFELRRQEESGWWLLVWMADSAGKVLHTAEPTRDLTKVFSFSSAGREVQLRLLAAS